MRPYRPLVLSLLLVTASCRSSTAPAPASARVQFVLDAPFCLGSHIPLQFSIDGHVVGNQTMMDGDSSAVFTTPAGEHEVKSEFVDHAYLQDTTVTLRAGEKFIQVMDFYCS